ncbi:hypothetical protein T265_13843 [Opisthorchis viverrini]|uniref:Uncharacterized protein n=1 Tax=Opisthorchis viverrini TaxID=6198 RepID=A0A074ZJP8_OPIVI|nr:hypothetical protein T265_13843 [Opisthorchis viverrini]KER27211.1 hypothetical protein T265_13843 [Opisthorchis viverrini]
MGTQMTQNLTNGCANGANLGSGFEPEGVTLNGSTECNGHKQCNGHSECNGHETVKQNGSQTLVNKPGRFICRGYYDDLVHLSAETGYLIWIEPASSMRVLFTYGSTQCDFLCYLEPEVPGVAITLLHDEQTYDQRTHGRHYHRPTPFHSGMSASSAGATGTRHSCLRTVLNPYSYAVDSSDGQCFVELRALPENQLKSIKEPIKRPFKLNFQLVL